MVLYEADYALLLRQGNELIVVFQDLHSGLRQKNMQFAFQRIFRDGIMRG